MRNSHTDALRLLFVFLLLAPLVLAQDTLSPHAALRGLHGVGILVHPLDRKLIKDGVAESGLQAVVKRELEEAAIPVLNTPEGLPEEAPLLEVTVGAVKEPNGAFYILDLNVKLRRRSLVKREKASAAERAGWERSWSGMVPVNRIDTIHKRLRSFAQEFSSAYLAVNQEPRAPDRNN